MEKIKLLDEELNVVYSDLSQECEECFTDCSVESELVEKCSLNFKKCRRGIKKFETGLAFYCSENTDDVKSSKCFKKKIELYGSIVDSVGRISEVIRKRVNANTEILLHNLVSLNAHNIQEVHAVIPQDNVGLNFKEKNSHC